MRQIALEDTDLASCIKQARSERVVIVRAGRPAALIVNLEGLDAEQLELGGSAKFWRLIAERRKAKTINRAGLEKRLAAGSAGKPAR